MAFDIVTFDTQVVQTNSYDFDGGLLNKLLNLKHDTVDVVISDVVKLEILKHLTDHTQAIIDRLNSARRQAIDFGVIEGSLTDKTDRSDAGIIASNRFHGYLEDLGAKIIPVSNVQVSELMDMYFSSKPPFGAGKKKNEFPDAVTLVAIERYAKQRGAKVLAISGDSDWLAYAKQSNCIEVVDTISKALEMLNAQSSSGRVAAGKILDQIALLDNNKTTDQLQSQIESKLKSVYISADARSSYYIRSDYANIELIDIMKIDVPSFTLVDAREDLSELVVEIEAFLFVAATASFELSRHYDKDGVYVFLGSTSKTVREAIRVRLMITITNDNSVPQITNLEFLQYPASIDFGDVFPSYGGSFYEESNSRKADS